MRKLLLLVALAPALFLSPVAKATQADETTITIEADTPGATPFIHQLELATGDTSIIKSIRFTVAPKPGSVTRPLSGTYANDYLVERGFLQGEEIFIPIYGLYSNYTNTVTLTYFFLDGSSKQDSTSITTEAFDDPCGYDEPTVLQARTKSTALSYDYILIRGSCSEFSPVVIDTDGALRWVGPGGFASAHVNFFDNAFYIASATSLYRIDLDGTVTFLHDYSDIGVTSFHHNIDRGKTGLILDVNTDDHKESLNLEVDGAGTVLKMWDMVDVISNAMLAAGDDPNDFVVPSSEDWFHNNATAYNRADDSLVVSSRENFVICLDYETDAIKWILGDTTKKWYQFPSLAQYALTVPSGSLPPIGQHALSITYDQNLLLFDNGLASFFQQPIGIQRGYASPRKYQIDLEAMTATEVWNFEMNQSIVSPICSSVYEDAPLNYVMDYALVGGFAATTPFAQLLGLNAADETVFYYQYPTTFCGTAYGTIPLHLEKTKFPTVMPRALNISTRGTVGAGDDSLIGGFIVMGSETQTVVLRALGPSLSSSGLSDTVADPVLTLYDPSGMAIATNDDWQDDFGATQIGANGLAPTDPAEAATVQDLTPGAYTFVVTGKDVTPGTGLVEVYDLSELSTSKLANLSTRGLVGSGDDVLISGFIVGDVASNTLVIRAIGPSLGSAGLSDPLSDPMLTVYDDNGAAIATNDNWQDDNSAMDIAKNELAPTEEAQAATILHLPAGAYTTIVSGTNGATGTGLVEVFDLD